MPDFRPVGYAPCMMDQPTARPGNKPLKPAEAQSQDAARLAKQKPRPAWETRQPAQVTKADVEQARADPAQVRPPGEMGEAQGAAS